MLRILSILLLSILTAIASDPRPFTFSDQAFLNAVLPSGAARVDNHNLVTNITGYPVYAWWPVDSNVGTNGSTFTLTNLASWSESGGKTADLTNKVAGEFPIYGATKLNGNNVLTFDGVDDGLKQLGITSDTGGYYEGWMVMMYTNNVASEAFFYPRSANNGGPDLGTSARLRVGLATAIYDGTPSNKWMVLNWVALSTTTSAFYTNGICVNTATPSGAIDNTRFVMGLNNSSAANANMLMAETIWYRTNLGSVDAAGAAYAAGGVRSNVWYYLTNKYAITIP